MFAKWLGNALYYEETDLCKRFKIKGEKLYLIPSARYNHLGGRSHNSEYDKKVEISRNWHYMWSMFYFHNKHNGILIAYAITIPLLIRAGFNLILYYSINRYKFKKYKSRFDGLLNAYMGKKSWFRPL